MTLLPVAIVALVLFAIGVEAFARRDIGATSPIPTPSLPRALIGLRGPTGRAVGQNLPTSIAWGIGIGLFGLAIAGSGKSFIDELGKATDFVKLLNNVFPGFDIRSVGGFLQLLYVEFGLILAGLAAATLVAVWGSDETSGRLEFLLGVAAVAQSAGSRRAESRSWSASWSSRSSRRSASRSGRSSPAATSSSRWSGRSCSGSTRRRSRASASRSVGCFGRAGRRRPWRSSRS